MNRLLLNSNAISKKERFLSVILKLIFALVMIGAGALILILFEGLIPVNIYLIYLSVGIILGLSVILIISTISESS